MILNVKGQDNTTLSEPRDLLIKKIQNLISVFAISVFTSIT